jgi:hypothetical protein
LSKPFIEIENLKGTDDESCNESSNRGNKNIPREIIRISCGGVVIKISKKAFLKQRINYTETSHITPKGTIRKIFLLVFGDSIDQN